MSEWEVKRLDDVADRVTSKNSVGHERVLSVVAGQGLVDQESYFKKRVASADLSGYWIVEPGDFVYNKSTSQDAPWGVVARWDGDGPAVVTSLYVVFRARRDVDSDYLLHACNSAFFFDSLRGKLREGARAHGLLNVRLDEFFGAHLLFPSLAKQRRIVDLMHAVDAQFESVITERDRLNRTTSALRADLLTPAPHWERVSIGEVAVTATGRAFPPRFQGQTSGVLPYFKVSDMNLPGNEREMRVAPNWLTEESLSQVKPRVCPAGTVLFPIIGAALRTEKRRVLVQPSAFDQNVMGLILSDRITTDFMFAVMSNLRLGELSQKGAVPSVNQKLVSAICFALPPLEEQMLIGEQLRALYARRASLEDELSRLRMLRSSLLTSLLTQEIEIPDSYDRLLEEVS
ncbi:restriction endonuclease subunit S [Microbacterium sp.]|uniref:restriction endonuclease subunit S n=1 Tax=Microbacterium sp. TaxID=51671 RepID=UPI001AD1450A|nr:restriction endonuclease subunit S [Microbacterium sp.]MBN9158140.1 restriction endonuclease subunit S [Microbacterium sp.]